MKTKLLFALLVFLPLYLFAQDAPKGEYDDVAKAVEKRILSNKKVKIDNLKVLHNGETIYLEGVTDLLGSKYLAEKESLKKKGIKNVDNQIVVQPVRDVSDNEIQAELIRKINNNLKGTPFDLIGVEVNHGFVKLSGNVRDQTLPEKSYEDAMWIPGVRNVDNQIQLSSISAGDERLRQAIFRRLRAEYPQYFLGKTPSIMIIVDGGRVLLTGYVNSEAEKQKMMSMVRSMSGVLSVNDGLKTNQ